MFKLIEKRFFFEVCFEISSYDFGFMIEFSCFEDWVWKSKIFILIKKDYRRWENIVKLIEGVL